jgi:hypothetical protein
MTVAANAIVLLRSAFSMNHCLTNSLCRLTALAVFSSLGIGAVIYINGLSSKNDNFTHFATPVLFTAMLKERAEREKKRGKVEQVMAGSRRNRSGRGRAAADGRRHNSGVGLRKLRSAHRLVGVFSSR